MPFAYAQTGAVDEFGDPTDTRTERVDEFGDPIDVTPPVQGTGGAVNVGQPTSGGTRVIGSDEFGDFGKSYKLLAPIGDIGEVATGDASFGIYLGRIFQFVIGAAGILAVLMIVWGGTEYLLSEAFDTKKAAVNRMQAAVWGLLLAFGSWLILNTVNPNLLNLGIVVPKITLQELVLVPTQSDLLLQKTVTAPNASENRLAQVHRTSVDGVLDVNLLYATPEYKNASAADRRALQSKILKSFEDQCAKKGGAITSATGGRTACEIPLQTR